MHGHTMESQSISAMPMDELLKLATQGPRPPEERWQDRELQGIHLDLARLDARCNALAEIARRGTTPFTPLKPVEGQAIPLGGQHAAPVGEHAAGIEGEELLCLAACAGLLREASETLLRVANSLAVHTARPAA